METTKWMMTAYASDRAFYYGPFESYTDAVDKAMDVLDQPEGVDLRTRFEELAPRGTRKSKEYALVDPRAIDAIVISEVS